MSRADSISIRLEQLPKQPIGPALRHSLGVSISGCLMGITVAFSASALDDFEDDYYLRPPTVTQSQWFSSLAALVALVSGFAFGRLVSLLGKKHSLIISSIFYFIGYTLMAYSKDYTLLLVGRGVTGLGLSITCLALSPYISEIAPTQHRGKFTSVMQLQVQLGILIINFFGVSNIPYRWNAAISSIIAVLNLFFIVIAPETPRWLVAKGRVYEAETILDLLMEDDPDLVREEMEVLHRSRRTDLPQDNDGTVHFFSKQNLKPLAIMCLIMVFQQLTAINAVLADSNRIFKDIGFDYPRVCTVAMSAAFLLLTFGSAALTDKAGRKLLLVVFAVLIAVSLGLFSLAGFLSSGLHLGLLIVGLGSYVFSFAMAWGNIPWVLCGELFTIENQGRAISIVSGVNWSFNFLTVFSWSYLSNHLSPRWVFLGYALCMVVAAVVVAVLLPETRGLTLHQITDLFAPNSAQYVTVVHRMPVGSFDQSSSHVGSYNKNENFI